MTGVTGTLADMADPLDIVIIGGGIAAAHAARELRDRGHEGTLTVLAAESHAPYERPPLSKDLLLGQAEPDSTQVLDPGWYVDQDVDLRTGTAATGIDLDRRHVLIGDDTLPYDRLLLATGATPRRLEELEGGEIPVAYLRTLGDSVALKARLSGRVLIVGAGWIGLEVAAAARAAGAEVIVVDPAAQPLLGVLGPEVAARFADLHRDHGVDLRLETTIESLEGGVVTLSGGERVSPDLIVVGIGAAPDDALAREAGLDVDDGIGGVSVDASLRSSDPFVFAAGDVASHDHPVLGRRIRVEHWDTAIHQGQAAARTMLGDDAAYDRQPFFFTDQYDVGAEYVGSLGPDGYDSVVVRGDSLVDGLTALWIHEGVVVAGMQANDWDATDQLWRLVGRDAPAAVADLSVSLKDLLAP